MSAMSAAYTPIVFSLNSRRIQPEFEENSASKLSLIDFILELNTNRMNLTNKKSSVNCQL